ncbi:hypothetical protein [Streptomyces sp. NPDC059909]|uniref:hypothetical protein n=1 Tax=Streptomyces sp. NPDC059909 TaxID=3346998 RepID=UPI00365110CD
MSVARRPLLTATAAGTLLCALWFVPSANATAGAEGAEQASGASASAAAPASASASASRQGGSDELRLAETGSVDTTPYLIGGVTFLGIGAGFVSFAVRQGARIY